jgi:hypothetical protein
MNAAVVALDKRVNRAGEQIYAGQQAAVALVLMGRQRRQGQRCPDGHSR